MATVAAGINNAVFGERYKVLREEQDQYGNDTGEPLSFECEAVPHDKEFSQKLDGERIGTNFKGQIAVVVPTLRFRVDDLPEGFEFKEDDRIEQLDHEKQEYVVARVLNSSNGLVTLEVSAA